MSDYVRAWTQLVAGHVRAPLTALRADGFGRSDTLRLLHSFFEIDRGRIVLAALTQLRAQGAIYADTCLEAIRCYGIDRDRAPNWLC